MKKLLFFILVLFIGCTASTNEPNVFQQIEKELNAERINDTLTTRKKRIIGEKMNCTIFYNSEKKLINEIDIHINSKQDSIYQKLVKYYNKKFHSTKNDTIYNTWQTDSSEFILYKNSDSSILVNIFKRNYL